MELMDTTWMTRAEEACWNPQSPAMVHKWMGSSDLNTLNKTNKLNSWLGPQIIKQDNNQQT